MSSAQTYMKLSNGNGDVQPATQLGERGGVVLRRQVVAMKGPPTAVRVRTSMCILEDLTAEK